MVLEAASWQEAIEKLVEGNQRYFTGQSKAQCDCISRRYATLTSQTPFAVVVGCSDSRVCPEILFDQGIGDLFVVRVAAGVVGPLELESIFFSVFQLRTPLIVVLGHEDCAAIRATLEKDGSMPLVSSLIGTLPFEKEDVTLTCSVRAHVEKVVSQLEQIDRFCPLIQEGQLRVLGSHYELNSGKVLFHGV